MDNKEQEKNISSLEFDKGKTRNDYKFLVQKLNYFYIIPNNKLQIIKIILNSIS